MTQFAAALVECERVNVRCESVCVRTRISLVVREESISQLTKSNYCTRRRVLWERAAAATARDADAATDFTAFRVSLKFPVCAPRAASCGSRNN
jgi:hypothetical protein